MDCTVVQAWIQSPLLLLEGFFPRLDEEMFILEDDSDFWWDDCPGE